MSSNRPAGPAGLGAVLGALAILAIPAAGVAAALTPQVTLLRAVYVAVPTASVLALAAFASYRRARARLERSVRRAGAGIVRTARFLAFSGLYLAVTGALALAFYGVLHLRS
jgi:hypothetical protein